MYLYSAKLKNYRSFDDCEIDFQPDLTVLVGENNGGKSNAIDAIRLLTMPLGGRREIYCESTDVRFQSAVPHFELEAHFSGLTTGQQGRLISAATDATLTKASFGLRFDGSRAGVRPTIWAGKEGNAPEPGCQDMVRHVYLPPLRDAKRALASGNPTRIMALLNHFLGETTPDELAKHLARSRSHDVLTSVDGAVEKGLTELTAGVRRQTAALGFASDESLVDIARDLRFKLADHGVVPEDLRYSGHGYANLLFMATIAVELEKVRSADLTLFLVEEPEAHLHPQLQAAVLAFLRDRADDSRKQPTTTYAPAGELQVVVATHSPNLSAWVSSDRLVVFKSVVASPEILAEDDSAAASPASVSSVIEDALTPADPGERGEPEEGLAAAVAAAASRRSTRCIALARMDLDPIERRKVDRYLDVTKAALLFGGRVLLVEGIAEALLLPAIAEHHTLKADKDKLRLFRSAVFIPIDGVDFSPYATLLLSAVNGARIADRVVVMTDGDKATGSDDDEEDAENPEEGAAAADAAQEDTEDPAPPEDVADGTISKMAGSLASAVTEKVAPATARALPGEQRKAALEKLAERLDATARLSVLTSTYSLEAELLEAGNGEILREAYLTLHCRSQKKWNAVAALSGDARAQAVHDLFKTTRKGDFAQVLARLIEDGKDPFVVPSYMAAAIEEVVAP